MKKNITFLVFLSILLSNSIFATDERIIEYAVKKCQKDVSNYCVTANICTDFCDLAYKYAKQKNNCKSECTPQKRCKAKVPDYTEISGNEELDRWTSDQLLQCIAEERDKVEMRTGRRMIHWKDIMTVSLAKILDRPVRLEN